MELRKATSRMRWALRLAGAAASVAALSPAVAQDGGEPVSRLTVWDLELGRHAWELPREEFFEFACGTNGGPPSLPLAGWAEYSRCPPERETGYREVYFRYDDEPEYWARAHDLQTRIAMYQGTHAYDIPVIVSGLFDGDGFLIGVRVASDPRTDADTREKGVLLGDFLAARFGEEGWVCEDIAPVSGEQEFRGSFTNRACVKELGENVRLALRMRYLRKPGQMALGRNRLRTEGEFESTTHFEAILAGGIADREPRLAALAPPGPTERELLAQRAMDCAGCDLRGAFLKRANLAGANLAGANLGGANLHAAILRGANLAGADLTGANLNRIDALRANFANAKMNGALMFEATLDGAMLAGAEMTQALARSIQMIRADVSGLTAVATDFRDGRLNDTDFAGADLSFSWFNGAQMARSNLTDASIAGARLWNASLVGTKLVRIDARNADLFAANLRGADMTGANFAGARLQRAVLANTLRDGAVFDQAVLPAGVRFRLAAVGVSAGQRIRSAQSPSRRTRPCSTCRCGSRGGGSPTGPDGGRLAVRQE